MTGPMRPEEARLLKGGGISRLVFDAFNLWIDRMLNGNIAIIELDDVVEVLEIVGLTIEEIDRSIPEALKAYRKAGWKIKGRRPCYDGVLSTSITLKFSR